MTMINQPASVCAVLFLFITVKGQFERDDTLRIMWIKFKCSIWLLLFRHLRYGYLRKHTEVSLQRTHVLFPYQGEETDWNTKTRDQIFTHWKLLNTKIIFQGLSNAWDFSRHLNQIFKSLSIPVPWINRLIDSMRTQHMNLCIYGRMIFSTIIWILCRI